MSSPPVPSSQSFITVIEPWKFEAIFPSQFITFTMQNRLTNRRLLDFPVLRVAVLDSPMANADDESPVIAAMVVPKKRESDWIFCTESGHRQLLLERHNVSRLILIGNKPPPKLGQVIYKRPTVTDTVEEDSLVNELKPLFVAMKLHPIVSFRFGSPETIFLTYEDDVAYRLTVDKLTGRIVGDFLVEDVEFVNKQLIRRLRFKRMPNLVQSQALLIPIFPHGEDKKQTDRLERLRKMKNVKFEADQSNLVDHYVISMVGGLYVIASHLNQRIQQGLTPRALCLGIGGGVLLSFLHTELGFQVVGVEADETVLIAAKRHFGLNKNHSMKLLAADAIEVIQIFTRSPPHSKFDVVFVDLDSSEAKFGCSAPPPEFIKKHIFEGLRSVLNEHGVLIINVIPLTLQFYTALVDELKENFHHAYGIHVEDHDNYVVMATMTSNFSHDNDNMFLAKLKSAIPATYMDSIVKLF